MGIFNDVVALAKAGWTPSDVKEILEKDKEMEQKKEPEEGKKKEPEEVKKKEPEEVKKKEPEDGKDYKALYESTQKALNEIQNKNTKEDMKPLETNMDDLIKDIKSHIS